MTNMIGLILSESYLQLNGLTDKRSVEALPIAGRYRLVDFMLSNMVNSDITSVGIVTKTKYSSLMDHLGSGKEWDLNRKNGGLHIIPPYSGRGIQGLSEGTIDLIASASSFIRRSKEDHIILSKGNIVANIDLKEVEKFHEENSADITLVYYESKEATNRDLGDHIVLEVDDNCRVRGIEIRPIRPKSRNVFMNMVLMGTGLLQYSIDEAYARGDRDFIRDLLIKNLSNLKICAYKFEGYVGFVHSVCTYYSANVDMLKEDVRREIFNSSRPIYTKIKDQVPARYGSEASVHNCLIADGCIIQGDVRDSIIFRGVNIGKNTKVSNCIIMQDSVIEAGCELKHVILDKEVTVRDGGRLIGDLTHPMIIDKGEVV
ncbi:MAG: glucose-1-phosphate adenylyltransferase subunit GlgD [Clostridiales bacterium]|nr:glucose-1-phosphate adenylyltransferase subunit GlgD [Clostridiales bacterium]